MEVFMKQTVVRTILVGVAAIMPLHAQGIRLSVAEAIAAIWKLNDRDTTSLHKLVIPEKGKHESEGAVTNNEAYPLADAIRKALDENRFGDTVISRILEAFDAATQAEQAAIKKAICDSYKEYNPELTAAEGLFAVLLFPISLITLVSKRIEHAKKIEAHRLAENTL
jgi:hypothetical protein